MDTAAVESIESETTHEDAIQEYRSLSRCAVASLLLAIVSLALFPFPLLLLVPALGMVLGLLAWRAIACYPHEWTGKWIAIVGTISCVLLLLGGIAGHSLIYATEVPEGYQRISFQQLQPDKQVPGELVPPSALDLNGQKVFVKGYVHPSVASLGRVRQFVLVPDMGTCCFGGQPKLTDMIEVTTPAKQPIQYSRRKMRLAGTLKVDTQLKSVDGLMGVFYQLEADYVE